MDYFNGITEDDFVTYFKIDLKSRMTLTQYTYPHEFLEPQDAIDDHIVRCQNLLTDYIRDCINENVYEKGLILKGDEINYIYDKKVKEIYPILQPVISEYIEKVIVEYIDLKRPHLED